MDLFKTTEEKKLEQQSLEQEASEFCKRYYLPNLSMEECLQFKKKFEIDKKAFLTTHSFDSYGTSAAYDNVFQNFYILEQLGRNQRELESLNNKLDTLIELLSKK